jgi:hypothetical protein
VAPGGPARVRGCRLGRAHSPVGASSLRRHVSRLPAPRRSSSATALPHRSNRPAQALRMNPSRPARPAPSGARQAPLLRFRSLQHTSAASRCPGGGRPAGTIPLRRFTPAAPALLGREPSFGGVSPVRFSASVAGSSVALLARRTCGTGRSIVPQTCRAVASTHSMIEWTCRSRRLHDPSRKCGRRNRRARSRRTRPSELCRSAISPPEPGHAPTRPLARCSATRCSGPNHAAQPAREVFPLSSPGGAPGVHALRRFAPESPGGRAAPRIPRPCGG